MVCDVSAVYGFNAAKLSKDQLIGYWMNIQRVEARRQMVTSVISEMEPAAAHELVLMATGSKAAAREAQLIAMEGRIARSTAKT